MAVINAKKLGIPGSQVVFTPADIGGDLISNSAGDVILLINNVGTASITVSATATLKCNRGFAHNLEEVIPAGEIRGIALNRDYNNNNGQVPISYTDVASVSIAAIRR